MVLIKLTFMKLKKGDKIKVTVGKDRGKDGTIERVFEKANRVSVPEVNMYKRHLKPRAEGQKGEIKELPRPIPVSNVALICPKCKKETKVGYKLIKEKKVRICRKCEEEI